MNEIIKRAITEQDVKPNGKRYTTPKSWGVYQLSESAGDTKKFRYGNHPVRKTELIRDFGSCSLIYLFLSRNDAKSVATTLNNK